MDRDVVGVNVPQLRAGLSQMLEELEFLVTHESPSANPTALGAAADAVAEVGARRLGVAPERVVVSGYPHLRWRFGSVARVAVIGHFDTVWPLGTLGAWPFETRDGRATGPGSFDMKAGIVQGFHALASVEDPDGVVVLLTSDEEIGSPTSRALIENTVADAKAALVLEPSAAAALKTARHGVSVYEITVEGRAAHAGLEPERGVNALVELAHQVLAFQRLARPGTTVTPTLARAGTAANAVPSEATVTVDVRAPTAEEQARVDRDVRALTPVLEGARITIDGGPNRPPMPPEASARLFSRAQELADVLGLAKLQGVAVRGGSDGNFTAAAGVPTLDGLGAVGAGAHARDEYVEVAAMPERAALVAALVEDVLGG